MLDKKLFQEMIDQGYLIVQKHPSADLWIYNYSRKTQFERYWTDITMLTRGLILDKDLNIVARPFKKFFNIEEHTADQIPNLPYKVYDKMDGSLGVLYWLNDLPFIASRGSFDSDQARHANEVLYNKYQHTFNKLLKGVTYLFEIIYPTNRIVLDYGEKDDLVLLAMIDNETGNDVPLHDIGFEVVKEFTGFNDLYKIRDNQLMDKEGYIVVFSNGFRVKMKFEEYCRLHSIVTMVSTTVIWKHLLSGKPLEELLADTPDEFDNFVRKTERDLMIRYNEVVSEANAVLAKVFCEMYREGKLYTQKELAEKILKEKNSGLLFSMIKGTDYFTSVFRKLKPKWEKPFVNNSDDNFESNQGE